MSRGAGRMARGSQPERGWARRCAGGSVVAGLFGSRMAAQPSPAWPSRASTEPSGAGLGSFPHPIPVGLANVMLKGWMGGCGGSLTPKNRKQKENFSLFFPLLNMVYRGVSSFSNWFSQARRKL